MKATIKDGFVVGLKKKKMTYLDVVSNLMIKQMNLALFTYDVSTLFTPGIFENIHMKDEININN